MTTINICAVKDHSLPEQTLYQTIKIGSKEYVENHLKAISLKKMTVNEQEQWQVRAQEGIYPISREEFSALPHKLQRQLYKIGNLYGNFSWVATLKSYGAGIDRSLVCKPVVPSILSDSMDILEMQAIISRYVDQLIQENRLFRRKTFAEWKGDKTFIDKSYIGLQRLWGREHLQKCITELGITSVRAPNKVAVIKESSNDKITFRLNSAYCAYHGHPTPSSFYLQSDDIEVYVERIQASGRKISRCEMEELITVIERSNFGDISECNFIVCEEAVYIIDTEYKSFSTEVNPCRLNLLACFLEEADHPWFNELVNRKMQKHREILEQINEIKRAFKHDIANRRKIGKAVGNINIIDRLCPKEFVCDVSLRKF